jgi:hypothetical protein
MGKRSPGRSGRAVRSMEPSPVAACIDRIGLICAQVARRRGRLFRGRVCNGAVHDPAGHALVTSYAVRRPDGDWALLLVNKDRDNPHKIEIAFEGSGGRTGSFYGEVNMVTFGSEQYVWHSAGATSHAEPDNPPLGSTIGSRIEAGRGATVTLPKCSVTVLRGKVQGLA